MRRREFITLLGGAAAWPLAARAEQSERVRRVGAFIAGAAETDPQSRARVAALLEGFAQRGWSEGRNLRIACPILCVSVVGTKEPPQNACQCLLLIG